MVLLLPPRDVARHEQHQQHAKHCRRLGPSSHDGVWSIFSFFSLQAQTEEKAKNLSTTAEITFEKLSHDYGTVTMDASGLTDFKFKNTGTEPLILSNVITTCGCTVPEWPKEPVLPGKTGVIKINYTRMKTPGVINKQVKVISNAKNGDII